MVRRLRGRNRNLCHVQGLLHHLSLLTAESLRRLHLLLLEIRHRRLQGLRASPLATKEA